jgi:hypothetical protein
LEEWDQINTVEDGNGRSINLIECTVDEEFSVNSFQASDPLAGQEKGVLFYGVVSPSKLGLIVPY